MNVLSPPPYLQPTPFFPFPQFLILFILHSFAKGNSVDLIQHRVCLCQTGITESDCRERHGQDRDAGEAIPAHNQFSEGEFCLREVKQDSLLHLQLLKSLQSS